jgi:hypothetical protein
MTQQTEADTAWSMWLAGRQPLRGGTASGLGVMREAFLAGRASSQVTAEQLAEALTEFRLTIRTASSPAYPKGLMETGTVADPAKVAAVLHATLSRIAAERAS